MSKVIRGVTQGFKLTVYKQHIVELLDFKLNIFFLFSDVVHDPFGFSSDPRSVAGSTSESWLSSRPRPRSSEKSETKRGRNRSKESASSFRPEYYNKMLTKVDKFLKVATEKIGKRSREENGKRNREESVTQQFWDSDEDCDHQLMAAKHLKCQVKLVQVIFTNLNLNDSFFNSL